MTFSGSTGRSRRRWERPWPPAPATALGADLAIADTGIAGPGGGTPEKPVGLVFLAVDGPGGAHTTRLQLPGDRETVRARATALALHTLRRELSRSTRRGLRTGARVEGDERLRLFCALLLPPAAVDGLVAWQTAELAPRGEKLRLVSPENLHVTLAFLGSTPAARAGEVAEALREACAGRERPLFAVGRYRETRSVAMIALTDEGGRGERHRGCALRRPRTARSLPAGRAPLASARHDRALSRPPAAQPVASRARRGRSVRRGRDDFSSASGRRAV